jgi:acyl-CoA thioesterase FadM
MFKRNFTVKGEDVNDFMVMQNFAYLKYTSKMIEVFLLEKGFSTIKLNDLKIGWQKRNDQLKNNKKLMFTQAFDIELTFDIVAELDDKMYVSVHFYNSNNELCSTVTTELFWIDYTNWEVILPPKKIAQHFYSAQTYRRAV